MFICRLILNLRPGMTLTMSTFSGNSSLLRVAT